MIESSEIQKAYPWPLIPYKLYDIISYKSPRICLLCFRRLYHWYMIIYRSMPINGLHLCFHKIQPISHFYLIDDRFFYFGQWKIINCRDWILSVIINYIYKRKSMLAFFAFSFLKIIGQSKKILYSAFFLQALKLTMESVGFAEISYPV